MKNLNKMLSMLLALVMMFAIGICNVSSVMAEDGEYTITFEDDGSPYVNYEVYQIFSGNLVDGKLTQINWGSGLDGGQSEVFEGKTAMEVAESLKTEDEAMAFAKKVAPYLTNELGRDYFNGNTATVSEPGYYLIKHIDNSQTGTGSAYTPFILQVVGKVTVKSKAEVPTVEKKVKDVNDSIGDTSDWQDSADYDIGDDVPFKLTATLPNNVDLYNKYSIAFVDTLSAGLEYVADSVHIKIDGTSIDVSKFTVDQKSENNLVIKCGDVKELGVGNGSVITVEYDARLKDTAVIGNQGNPNTVKLVYSNNPNVNYTGGFDNNDTPTDEDGGNNSGETPDDKVVVFTYQLKVIKRDEAGDALFGADFELYKKDINTGDYTIKVNKIERDENDDPSVFDFMGLDDGDYKLVETTAPEGYNKAEDIYFTIEADHDEDAADNDPKLIILKVIDENGNEINDFDPNKFDGIIETNVVNYKGITLPETGGMGTKLIYLVGGALAIAASVLLVTKRRMGKLNNEQ